MNRNIILILPLLALLSNCRSHRFDELIELGEPSETFSNLTDSTFIVDVRDMSFVEGNYYLADYQRGQIFKLDSNLVLKFTYGSSGTGPGEFNGLARIAIFNDSIYAINDGKKTIEVLSLNNRFPFRQIKLPINLVGSGFGMRFIADNNLFFGVYDSNFPITEMSYDGNIVKSFGEAYNFNNNTQNYIRNNRSLFLYNKMIVTVSDNMPFLEMYDTNGQLKLKKNISEVKVIHDRLDFIDQQPNEDERSFYNLYEDAYIDGSKLYLLCITGREKPLANVVVIFNILNDGFEYKQTLKLPSRWYGALCVQGKHLLTFCHTTNEMQYFEIY